MKEISFQPQLYCFESVEDYTKEFPFKGTDLVITIHHIYDNYLRDYTLESDIIFIDDYISGEPTDIAIDIIAKAINFTDVKRIIAIGGGSCMDIAKLLSIAKNKPISELIASSDVPKRLVELLLIPTTCGTGSEVTNIAALEATTLGTKLGYATDALYSDYAILIVELIQQLPQRVFMASSVDALIHAIESLLSPYSTDLSRTFSHQAIDLILSGYTLITRKNYLTALKEWGRNFLLASTYAGLAFGTGGCAAVHALSYPIGGNYHVPHGEANFSVFIPVLHKYEEKKDNQQLTELKVLIAERLDCAPEDAFNILDKMLGSLLPVVDLKAKGFNPHTVLYFAKSVLKNQQRLLKNNYVPLSESDIVDIYSQLL